MSGCCHTHEHDHHHNNANKSWYKKFDWLLWVCLSLVAAGYASHLFAFGVGTPLEHFGHGVFELMNTMWWGLLVGIFFVGLLQGVPKEFVMKVLGRGGTASGIARATLSGVLLDLCSHGILLVASQLYKRGASLGQVMAFLIASPWNSFSLTFVLFALIGLKWTLLFIALSAVVAFISGMVFDRLVKVGILPENSNKIDLPADFAFFAEAKKQVKMIPFGPRWLGKVAIGGLRESEMILRWLFLGVVIAALLRTFLTPDQFADYFGPTIAGLAITLLAATIIEVCSEGSSPIAADILTRAAAPGNGFVFLMAGASTDYTEILVMREATKSWKVAFFLPLVTVPQIVVLGWILNTF